MNSNDPNQSTSRKYIVNVLLIALAGFVLYQLYGISSSSSGSTHELTSPASSSTRVMQVDVLNGCGVSGVGQKMTSFLRLIGYDVVEMGNYKTFDVRESFVVDRSGDLEAARKLALEIGIAPKNVIQQISTEYFVAASVVIGKDYRRLMTPK